MALTILQRPKGYTLDLSTQANVDILDTAGDAFLSSAHTLVTGDTVYVSSPVEEYNGFFQVLVISPTTFKLYYDQTTDIVSFIQEVSSDPTAYFIQANYTHGWSAVHLPITYKISNTLWPTNSVDTARTILTLNDDLGYARVTLSGSLGTFEDLSFVKISGASNSDFDGVYQVLDKLSTTDITLNVAYNTFNGSGLLGASIQLYYGNYNVVVRVYAGINSSHEWTAQKPYELAATLELIPDSNNQVFFSINEILKAYVKSVNNLLLGTMPNNIDAWTNFYISIAEQYDTSNGYTVSTNLTSFSSDQSTFEGTAVNAVLPFKNIHSGSLSEYLMTNNTAKFLTLFTIPVLFQCGDNTPDCYSDISFLNPETTAAILTTLRKQFYLNGNGPVNVDVAVSEDYGVIRMELEADCNYDRVDIVLLGYLQLLDEPELNATGDWLQTTTFGPSWAISGGMASVIMPTSFPSSEMLYQSISGSAGNYRIVSSLNTSASTGADWTYQPTVYFLTGGVGGSVVTSQVLGTLSGTGVGNVPAISYDNVIAVAGSFDTIAIQLPGVLPDSSFGATVNLLNLLVYSSDQELSETKQFDIDCGCSDQEIRLTWLNYLGGFEHWTFNTETGHAIDITKTNETTKNIFPEWPKSYGEFSDTIRKQTSRESTNRIFLTTQYLTESQADALAYIKTSPLVQIINSRTDRRTIIVDSDSFTKYTDNQKLITIGFSARYTDNIGSQKV